MLEKLKKSGRISTINVFKPSTKEQLQDAVTEWLNNESNNSYGGLHISYWDTSLITDMSELFKLQSNFNDDISGWNVGNVTNFNEMFKGATSFNQNLDNWILNSSNPITMNGMFDGATSFNGSINNWNVGRVTEMNSMFWRASKFNQPLDNWNVSRVLSMNGMFGHATSFNQNLSSWILNDNCNIENIFSYSTSLSEENRSNFASNVDKTIYVSPGFSSPPFYIFYENSNGANEINPLILDISKTYKFQMLSNSDNHPFYIGNNGWRQQSLSNLNFGEDGNHEEGLNTKDQYFTLSFNGTVGDIGTLIYYCTNQSHNWMNKSITLINSYDDFSDDISNTGTLEIGNSATGEIETTDDKDWFKVNLIAGSEYRFTLNKHNKNLKLLYGSGIEITPTSTDIQNKNFFYIATTTGNHYLECSGDIGTYIITACKMAIEEEQITSCDSYEWYGTTYTESGIYEHIIGCKKKKLNLTINKSTDNIKVVLACDSYEWYGTTYTESTKTAVYTTLNENDCDHVETLDLIIYYSTIGTTEKVEECDSYEWYGTTYTESGTYKYTSLNENGCDNVETLNLTINNSTSKNRTVTACDSYTLNGFTYTETGSYINTSRDENGCTHTTYLTLNIINSPTVSAGSDQTICLGESVTLNATGASSYLWSTGQNTSSITVEPTKTTTYKVTGTSNYCSESAEVTITVDTNCEVLIEDVTIQLNVGWNLIGQCNYENAKIASDISSVFYIFGNTGYEELVDDNGYITLPKDKGVWLYSNTNKLVPLKIEN